MLNLTVVDTDTEGILAWGTGSIEPTVWHNQDGTVCAYVYSRGEEFILSFPRIAKFIFKDGSADTLAIREPSATTDLVEDTYRRIVLPMRLQQQGTEVLHASAVIMNRQVVALCAPSGSGKSTTAFALSRRGYEAWADDVVAFRITPSCIEAIPLPFRVRLRRDVANLLGKDQAEQYSKTRHNRSVHVREKTLSLRTLIVLNRLSDPVAPVIESHRLSPDHSFVTVLSHAWCFSLEDQNRKRIMMRTYLNLVATLAVFEIRYQEGLDKLDILLDRIENLFASS